MTSDLSVVVRPIGVYPVTETPIRIDSRFSRQTFSSGRQRILLSDGLTLLDREARFLETKRLIIEADFKETEIRSDGWPKATAKTATPRVVINLIGTKHGDVRYPCDTFTRFEDNIRAVGLALEALRKVERYGVTRRGEQYQGWKALGSGNGTGAMTVEAALALFATFLSPRQSKMSTEEYYRAAYRAAVTATHPDRAGGSASAFQQVQEARTVLFAHAKIT